MRTFGLGVNSDHRPYDRGVSVADCVVGPAALVGWKVHTLKFLRQQQRTAHPCQSPANLQHPCGNKACYPDPTCGPTVHQALIGLAILRTTTRSTKYDSHSVWVRPTGPAPPKTLCSLSNQSQQHLRVGDLAGVAAWGSHEDSLSRRKATNAKNTCREAKPTAPELKKQPILYRMFREILRNFDERA